MKLWDDLSGKEQQAIVKLALDLLEIIDKGVVLPLTKLFDQLCWFFMVAEGTITESQYNHLTHH